jgi:hypothetical protein
MRRRYFTRVLAPFGSYRPDHEPCLEEAEFAAVRGKGLVQVLYEEHDGKRVDVAVDEGAAPKRAPAPPKPAKDDDVPFDTLDDEEKAIILSRRQKAERKKAEDEAKAKADAEKSARKKAEDEAKAVAKK